MTTRTRGPHNGGTNLHCEEMDRLLEKAPPIIRWEKNKRGVMVAVEVHDPHGETSTTGQANRLRASADRAERELMEDEAREVAERFRKHRANNTPLLAAARTEI